MFCKYPNCPKPSILYTENWSVGGLCYKHFEDLDKIYANPSQLVTDDLIKIHVLIQYDVPKCRQWMEEFEKQMQCAKNTPAVCYPSLQGGSDPRFTKNGGGRDDYFKLSRALEYFEGYCWFPANRVLLGGLLSSEAFLQATEMGFNKDPGAGIRHGAQTHRIQWHVIMREVTNNFTTPVSGKGRWNHSPLQLFWIMTHSPEGKDYWAKALDFAGNQGWGHPDRLMDDLRQANETFTQPALEHAIGKRMHFDVGKVNRTTPFIDSTKVRILRGVIRSEDFSYDYRRFYNAHKFTPTQTAAQDERKQAFFEESILEKIYLMEKVGFPRATVHGSLERFVYLVYLRAIEAAGRTGDQALFKPLDSVGKYKLNELGLPVKKVRPDEGVSIAGRLDPSKNGFNTASYSYLKSCGAFPREVGRW